MMDTNRWPAAWILAWGVVLILTEGMEGKTRDFDASDVTWAHAVNSREMLENELNGSVNFLEADVSLGLLKGSEFGIYIPIMAHPPETVSDISLEGWLDTVIQRNTGKGVKLDFKVLEVVDPSLDILRRKADQLNFTIWLNADILPGPVHAPRVPSMEEQFMFLCHQNFPDALMSVGWTTEWYPTLPEETWHYDWQHVRKMADTIRCFFPESQPKNFSFPVRGIFASRSIPQLRWLLAVIPGSSLTVWTVSGLRSDPLRVDDLVAIRKSFPKDEVYYDLPNDLREEFAKVKNANVDGKFDADGVEHWMTLKRGMDGSGCSSNTYITNDTVMFGKSMYTAVLLKKLLTTDDKKDLKIEGKFEFFDDVPSSKKIQVSIVLVDVSLFSKNMTLDLTGSDSDVLWSALNASHVYTFEETPSSDRCRVFSLDTSRDPSFQVWGVHCDDAREGGSLEEVTSKGVQEVPPSKRLVLPQVPVMIGFVSSGEGHVVLSDFKVEEVDRTRDVSASSVVEVSVGLLSLTFLSFVMSLIFM